MQSAGAAGVWRMDAVGLPFVSVFVTFITLRPLQSAYDAKELIIYLTSPLLYPGT
ncbi:hypothetical protein J3R82DRAFT_4908 [Butyriboletus roseoflavus]|nr:hypothetical protein J3R82DRAFT_8315 [Butyriboletus roseoflavus]KAG8219131.1 hypothetical protein J3R82DRAFT_4990 [Butyriboletus roseoflavus]KAG8219186.1 hypothetical protein J3R82DRAFT_4908 [Butyriboletus roseoflavus]